jgi:hypothetical protein
MKWAAENSGDNKDSGKKAKVAVAGGSEKDFVDRISDPRIYELGLEDEEH